MTETQTAEQINAATDASIQARTDQIVADAKTDAKPKATPKKAPAKATAKAPKAEPKPTVTAEPKVDQRAAKQELVRIAIQAVADAVQKANGLKRTGYLAAFDGDEALQIVAQMTHHFPTGRDESGARWWPQNLPRPDRSDWR